MEGRNFYERVWYRLYGKLSVYQTGPRAGQEVLQLHPSLDMIHNGPVLQSVQVPERRPAVHGVLLLGSVQEQGTGDAVTHHV